ncbi:GNAT family N-acetyltransferase [Pseudonocardia petroleophila]|uniref:GNAT family N-acetyltransferase n=1 Tax=Pseudonocardia petroleophila TaxID=37331 RepID=A0A7G7MS08_9PSEU|nr:GNAT family N-acetyltransferase [Pseudonocardia petroleophila]
MDAVEINAGAWYLRVPRADDRMDDGPAVVASCLDPEIRRWRHRPPADPAEADAYIRRRALDWARDERYTWAVCEPTTGEMLGEVSLDHVDLPMAQAEAACWALPAARGTGMTTTALSAVLRFAFAGLGLHRVGYLWAAGNAASGRVAEKCGFRTEGRMRDAWLADGTYHDVIVTSILATDR